VASCLVNGSIQWQFFIFNCHCRSASSQWCEAILCLSGGSPSTPRWHCITCSIICFFSVLPVIICIWLFPKVLVQSIWKWLTFHSIFLHAKPQAQQHKGMPFTAVDMLCPFHRALCCLWYFYSISIFWNFHNWSCSTTAWWCCHCHIVLHYAQPVQRSFTQWSLWWSLSMVILCLGIYAPFRNHGR